MSEQSKAYTMRTLRFHAYGEPAKVLTLERAPVPEVTAGRVRASVRACGLNAADWGLCRGLFPGKLPRGVGLDVAGIVDAVGEGVKDIALGDHVVGTADFVGSTSAGASDFAILDHWTRAPAKLDFVSAAALPMAVLTAWHHLDILGVAAGQTVLVHGAGSSMGFAAVQMALLRGARVVATAGPTYSERLRAMGAQVTSYGEGMADRVQALAGGPLDFALDAAPATGDAEWVNKLMQGVADAAQNGVMVGSALPELVRAAGGDPRRVLTMSDMKSAAALGARTTFDLGNPPRSYAALGEFVERTAKGEFSVPVARTFALEEWRAALEISMSRKARGKLVLVLHV